jgi:uncharacterized membrane protein YvlD (DUF360 family)
MNPQVKYSLMAAGLYFVVANPVTYQIVQAVLGGLVTISGPGGATQIGTAVHAAVFGLLSFLLMRLTSKAAKYESV